MDKEKQIKSVILKAGLERVLQIIDKEARSDKMIMDCLKALVMLESENLGWYREEYKKVIREHCK